MPKRCHANVCLVTALTVADFVDAEVTEDAHTFTGAQIGVLTLAAILQTLGYSPHVVSIDDLFLEFQKDAKSRSVDAVADPEQSRLAGNGGTDTSGYFFPYASEHLKSLSFDVFGFSTICSSYPLTLRLAAEVRRLNPNAVIILGGPQASVVDVPTMRAFSYVDFVVRGEADETFPALLDAISGDALGEGWYNIPGITFRRGDEVIRNPNAPVVHDLDRLPLPALHLDRDIRTRRGVHLEIGRGCPFACTFCSTNDFFRRHFRLKSPQTMIDQMKDVKLQYGLSYFSLIHDMYTIDRKKVAEFCEALLSCGDQFTWGCSARTDCISEDLIGLMAKAGCRGIFFGIETGSKHLQSVINKKLDLSEAWDHIKCADRHGIGTAVALISGFPEETRDDLRDTIHFFVDSLRFDHAEPQLSLLAPLAATPIYEQHKDQLVLDYIYSDMSYQGWRQDPADVELIKRYPEIFPNFYAVPTTWLDRSYVRGIRDFVTYVSAWFRWLPVALLQDRGDFLEIFDSWQKWLREKNIEPAGEKIGIIPYYCHRNFRADFLDFVCDFYVDQMATARAAIVSLARVEGASLRRGGKLAAADGDSCGNFEIALFPYRVENALVVDIEVDLIELVDGLRNRRDLTQLAEKEVAVVLLATNEGRVQIWQLAPLSRMLLQLCTGRLAVREIVEEFCRITAEVDGIPGETVCLFGLKLLQDQGFIAASARPMAAVEAAVDGDEESVAPKYSPPPEMAATQRPWPPDSGLAAL